MSLGKKDSTLENQLRYKINGLLWVGQVEKIKLLELEKKGLTLSTGIRICFCDSHSYSEKSISSLLFINHDMGA